VDASNKAVIGNSSVTSIGGYAGWTTFPSDRAFKRNVRDNVPGLAFITQLRPVTYNVDVEAINAALHSDNAPRVHEGDPPREITPEEGEAANAKSKIVYTGFIAQDVENAAKSIGYDFSGVDAPKGSEGHYGLRYAEFVVPLVKAVQEQQSIIEKQNELIGSQTSMISDQQAKMENMHIQLRELINRIEKLEQK
jgi:hypothetical protein